MKHLFQSLLLLALLLPTTATAYDFKVDGICYNINGNEASVTYGVFDDPMNNLYYSGTVTIPNTVTYNDITYSVTSIGDFAFKRCWYLDSINIPNSVTSIGESAFYYTCLTSVTIPNSVTSIGYAAFGACCLKSVTIPNSVSSIGNKAFSDCDALTSITVVSGNTTYDSRNSCNAIIETASNKLIAGCQNTIIPNSITSIGYGAFSDCNGLTSVTIPNSVTEICNYAFESCSDLTSVTIPNSVTTIGDHAFSGNLTDVHSYITNPSNVSCGVSLFSSYYGNLVRTLHVLPGMIASYQADENWYPYFGQIVEMELNGDANLDGFLSIADISDAIDYVLGFDVTPFYATNADINCNGRVDLGDIVSLIDMLLQN